MTDARQLQIANSIVNALEGYQANEPGSDLELTLTVRVLGAEYDQGLGGLIATFGLIPPHALSGFEEIKVPITKIKSLEAIANITSLEQ